MGDVAGFDGQMLPNARAARKNKRFVCGFFAEN